MFVTCLLTIYFQNNSWILKLIALKLGLHLDIYNVCCHKHVDYTGFFSYEENQGIY